MEQRKHNMVFEINFKFIVKYLSLHMNYLLHFITKKTSANKFNRY